MEWNKELIFLFDSSLECNGKEPSRERVRQKHKCILKANTSDFASECKALKA